MESIKCLLSVVTIILVLSCTELSDAAHTSAARRTPTRRSLAGLRTRDLLQDDSRALIYTADFEELAKQNITTGNHQFKERELKGALPLHPKTQDVQYGAYDLSPVMVGELITMVVEQLVRFRVIYRDMSRQAPTREWHFDLKLLLQYLSQFDVLMSY